MEHAAVDDYVAIYHRLAAVDCRDEFTAGTSLALYHLYAVPHIAELLAGTGQLAANLPGRISAVGSLLRSLMETGFSTDSSRGMLRAMNNAHRNFSISNDDYLYALSAFTVVPVMFAERHGSHRLTGLERQAAASFYRELGRHMGVQHLPSSYQEFKDFFNAYQRRHVAPTTAAQALAVATSDVVVAVMPGRRSPADLLDARVRAAVAPTARDLTVVQAAGGVPQYGKCR